MAPLARYARDMGGTIVVDVAGEPWISVRRVCEALDTVAEARALIVSAWADTQIVMVPRDDGERYPGLCISAATFPRWMLAICPGLCAANATPLLALYQHECHRWASDYYGLDWAAVDRTLYDAPWESAGRIKEPDLWAATEHALTIGSRPVVDRLADIEVYMGIVRGSRAEIDRSDSQAATAERE